MLNRNGAKYATKDFTPGKGISLPENGVLSCGEGIKPPAEGRGGEAPSEFLDDLRLQGL
jgi:hypothetical protein